MKKKNGPILCGVVTLVCACASQVLALDPKGVEATILEASRLACGGHTDAQWKSSGDALFIKDDEGDSIYRIDTSIREREVLVTHAGIGKLRRLVDRPRKTKKPMRMLI